MPPFPCHFPIVASPNRLRPYCTAIGSANRRGTDHTLSEPGPSVEPRFPSPVAWFAGHLGELPSFEQDQPVQIVDIHPLSSTHEREGLTGQRISRIEPHCSFQQRERRTDFAP